MKRDTELRPAVPLNFDLLPCCGFAGVWLKADFQADSSLSFFQCAAMNYGGWKAERRGAALISWLFIPGCLSPSALKPRRTELWQLSTRTGERQKHNQGETRGGKMMENVQRIKATWDGEI